MVVNSVFNGKHLWAKQNIYNGKNVHGRNTVEGDSNLVTLFDMFAI